MCNHTVEQVVDVPVLQFHETVEVSMAVAQELTSERIFEHLGVDPVHQIQEQSVEDHTTQARAELHGDADGERPFNPPCGLVWGQHC